METFPQATGPEAGDSRPRLSVVIPAFNEATRLPVSLPVIAGYLASHPEWLPSEMVVVDDGSTDATAACASDFAPPSGVAVRLFQHASNRGKGAAVRTGFGAARGDLVLLSDADLATPIDELPRVAAAAGRGVAIGSRAVDRSRILTAQPWWRDLMGRCFNRAVRTLAVGGLGDTQCGFKLFPGDLARDLASAQRVDGFAFDVELLMLCRSWRIPVVEVPVTWRHVELSRVRPVRHSVDMLVDLILLAVRRFRGRLPSRLESSRGRS